MRIGFDASMLVPGLRYTGMGEYTWKLLAHLALLDRDNEYLLFVYPGQSDLPEVGPNFKYIVLPRPRLGSFSALASHQWLLPRLAAREDLDLFHMPGVTVRPSHPGVPWRMPCPLVVTMHDAIPLLFYNGQNGPRLPWKLRLFYRLMLRNVSRASRVITVSESARRDILQATRLAPQQIVAVHNGLDFRPLVLSDKERDAWRIRLSLPRAYLLFAGSYEPRKNTGGVLRGYAAALRKGLTHHLALLVERESGYAPTVHRLADALGIRDHLHFLHGLGDEDLRALYTLADALVYPSLYEGFGFPPLQAMACGLPVVASNVSSLPEVLGDAALFVDPRSDQDIADAMLRVVSDKALREELSKAGLEQAKRFSWERAAKATVAVYEQVAGD